MLGRLRRAVKPLLRRIATPLAKRVPGPLAVSLSALPLAAAAALAMRGEVWAVAFTLALLAALADLIDGTVAELRHECSPQGNYLETVIDKIVEVVLLTGAATAHPTAAALAMGLSLLVGFAKARVGLVVVTDNEDWPAVADRADRMAVLLTGLFAAAVGGGQAALGLALWVLSAVSLAGLMQRVAYAWVLITRAEQSGTLLPYLQRRDESAPDDPFVSPR